MHKPAVSVEINADLSQVAQAMKDSHVFTIPVTDGDVIVGLISVEEILETFIHPS